MTTSQTEPAGRIAGLDYGTKRIGIAISDSRRTLASPYENYTRGGTDTDARRFKRLATEEAITLFVVGLPIHTDGNESQKSRESREFGAWIEKITGVPVEFFDERYTSAEAERHLIAAELTSKRRKQRMDMLAAQIMLSGYLESKLKGNALPQALDD